MRALAILFLFAGLAAAEPATLRFCVANEPGPFDPHHALSPDAVRFTEALFEGLTYEDPKTLVPRPGVAERWEVSADGKVWTFHLRDDAKWSNGAAVAARDFDWSWRRALAPGAKTAFPDPLFVIDGAEAFHDGDKTDFGVTVVDARTLRVRLRAPTPYFLHVLALPVAAPVYRWAVETHGENWTRPEHIVNNGPFLLGRRQRGVYRRLVKNPVYWNADAIRLDHADAFMMDPGEALFAFVNRRLDWNPGLWLPAADRAVAKLPAYRASTSFTSYFYWINTRRPHLADARVRRALCYAIDKAPLVKRGGRGGARATGAFVPPGVAGYEPADGLPHDPDRARALLAEAGYPGGKGMPPLDLLHNTSDTHAAVADHVRKQLKRTLGIVVRVRQRAWEGYQQDVDGGNFDLARGGWVGDYPDPITFLEVFGGENRSGYASPVYERLLAVARDTPAFLAAPDASLYEEVAEGRRLRALAAVFRAREARLLVMQEMERRLITRDCPLLPLFYYGHAHLVHPHVRGFHPNPRNVHPLRGFWIEGR